jgi:hypothetical protein
MTETGERLSGGTVGTVARGARRAGGQREGRGVRVARGARRAGGRREAVGAADPA